LRGRTADSISLGSWSRRGQGAAGEFARVAGGRRPPRLRRGAGGMGACIPRSELPGL